MPSRCRGFPGRPEPHWAHLTADSARVGDAVIFVDRGHVSQWWVPAEFYLFGHNGENGVMVRRMDTGGFAWTAATGVRQLMPRASWLPTGESRDEDGQGPTPMFAVEADMWTTWSRWEYDWRHREGTETVHRYVRQSQERAAARAAADRTPVRPSLWRPSLWRPYLVRRYCHQMAELLGWPVHEMYEFYRQRHGISPEDMDALRQVHGEAVAGPADDQEQDFVGYVGDFGLDRQPFLDE